MAFTFAPWEAATRNAGGPTPGARALMAYLRNRWAYAADWGIYEPRTVSGRTTLSHHAEGRALDIGITPLSPKAADLVKGMPIVEAIGAHGRRLGIDQLIFNKRIWSASAPSSKQFPGAHPHYDHIHIGLTRQAGANLNPATIQAVLGGTGAAGDQSVTLPSKSATHRVSATSLRVRAEPSLSAPITAGLGNETAVEQLPDTPRDIDGYRWVRVRAPSGGRLVTGWVASEYLTPIGDDGKQPTDDTSGMSENTHRVTATSLRLRTEPSTSADITVELVNGTVVVRLADPAREGDGHRWVRVRTTADGRSVEGWVASEYLAQGG